MENYALQTGIGMDTIETKFIAVHCYINNLRTRRHIISSLKYQSNFNPFSI